MAKFDFNDTVRVKTTVKTWFEIPGVGCHRGPRPGENASVFSISEDRLVAPQEQFPPGVIYGIEFSDGDAIEVHEDDLELIETECAPERAP